MTGRVTGAFNPSSLEMPMDKALQMYEVTGDGYFCIFAKKYLVLYDYRALTRYIFSGTHL